MTIQEAVLKQVQFLRKCHDDRKKAATDAAEALNELKKAEAIASQALLEGMALDSNKQPLALTNDISRKAYLKVQMAEAEKKHNSARADAESWSDKVEVERSVLSAIKDLRGDAELDMSHLTKYDI